MQNAKPCSFCGDGTHVEWHCPELVAPIRDTGMMKPPAGTPMSGGDDDSIKNLNHWLHLFTVHEDSTKTLESKWIALFVSEKYQRRRGAP